MPEFNAAFWRFFGDSKVVDEDGNPLVVYHGTHAKFSTFRVGSGGIYFTSDPRAAANFMGRGGVVVVVAAYLSIQNPLDITDAIDKYRRKKISFGVAKQLAMEGLTAEHDGVIFGGNRMNADEYVVFYPEQIKSVNNRGTWDADDPDITHNPSDDLETVDTEAWPDRYDHPKVSLAFTDAIMKAREGKIVGVLGNFLRGPRIRQRYEEALSTPVMVVNRPVQKGTKIGIPEWIDFYGGTGTFRGKLTIFVSNVDENELVKTLLHEGAHVVFKLRGMPYTPSDLGSVTGRSEYFKSDKEKMVDSFVDEAWHEPEDEEFASNPQTDKRTYYEIGHRGLKSKLWYGDEFNINVEDAEFDIDDKDVDPRNHHSDWALRMPWHGRFDPYSGEVSIMGGTMTEDWRQPSERMLDRLRETFGADVQIVQFNPVSRSGK